MKIPRFWIVPLLTVAALLLFATFGVAVARDWDEPEPDGAQLTETCLVLSADAEQVAPGEAVTLSGELTAEPTETLDAEDGESAEPDGCEVECYPEAGPCSAATIRPMQLGCVESPEDEGDYDDGDDEEDARTPVAGAEIAILASTDGCTWSAVGTTTTDADGAFSAIETLEVDTKFKAAFAGDEVYAEVCSDKVKVKVVAEVGAPFVPGASARANKRFHVKGKATPGAGRVTVTVYKRSHGKWTAKVASVRASVSGNVYKARLKLRAGTYKLSATQAGASGVHGASSPQRKLRVRARD